MDAVTNVVQFTASNPVLIFVVGALSVLSLYLTLTITRQRRQIAVLKAPPRRRYGFLGKPLYSFLIVGLFLGAVGITYVANSDTRPVTVNADTKVEITIKSETLSTTAEGNEVRLQVVPVVNGIEWGGANGPVFEAFWTGVGAGSFSQVEFELSRDNPGGFSKILRTGRYQITVDLIVNGRRINKTVTLDI